MRSVIISGNIPTIITNRLQYWENRSSFNVDSWQDLAYTVGNIERSVVKERRKVKRRYLLYYARIFDAKTRQQLGNLIDITPQGIMVLSPEPFQVGKKYHLQMELSEEVSTKAHMDLIGVARWSHPDIDPRLYNTGLKLVKLSAEDEEIIGQIISTFGFRDNIRLMD